MPRPPRSELTKSAAYSPETVEMALHVFAVTGNASEAERKVKAQFGKGPTSTTITKWASDDHFARFVEIREGVAEQIKSRVATMVEDELVETLKVQSKFRVKAEADLDKLEPRDRAGALRNIATSAGILATNLREMRPKEPIKVEHTLDVDSTLRKLAGLLGSDVAPTAIEGTAEEIEPDIAQPPGQVGSSEGVSGA